MKYSFILLSGGKGTRFKQSIPKQYLLFAGKPMIVHTLEAINKISQIEEIVIVCHDEYIETIDKYLTDYGIEKKIVYAPAGDSRQASVLNGLTFANCSNVIIHEAARPLVLTNDYIDLINCEYENATFSYSIPYTVLMKNEDNLISANLNRNELINIQLPQKFNKNILYDAHLRAKAEGKIFTEDVSLLYHYTKAHIFCMKGKLYNIKMTEYADLLYGEMLLKEDLVRE